MPDDDDIIDDLEEIRTAYAIRRDDTGKTIACRSRREAARFRDEFGGTILQRTIYAGPWEESPDA